MPRPGVDESSPTARALLCLQLLQYSSRITADRLARRPVGVVVRHGRWYLLCRAESGRRPGKVVRAYRLDRTREVEQLEGPPTSPSTSTR